MSDGQLGAKHQSGIPGLFFKDSNGDSVKIGPFTLAPRHQTQRLALAAKRATAKASNGWIPAAAGTSSRYGTAPHGAARTVNL
jgi:hypothetical protein